MRRFVLISVLAVLAVAVLAPAAQATFGFENFSLTFSDAEGNPALQAGSHPFAVTNILKFNSHLDPVLGEVPDETVKDLTVRLPPGLVGRPDAVPECSRADFINIDLNTKLPSCSDNSAVGVITLKGDFRAGTTVFTNAPVYNLVSAQGTVQTLGFSAYGVPVIIEFVVSPNPPFEAIAKLRYIAQTLPIIKSRLILWGNPASAAHDYQRGHCIAVGLSGGEGEVTEEEQEIIRTTGEVCPSSAPERSYITLPRSCTRPLITHYEASSWSAATTDGQGTAAPAMEGCVRLGFSPTIDAQPTSVATASPTGLSFDLNVQNEGLTAASGLAQSDIKKVVVALPEAVTVNPALAEGLSACSETDLTREAVASEPGEGCPNESKIGTVEVETPLLEKTLKGSLYLATPYENQFHSLLALYVVIKDPETGILIKLPGKVEPDPVTGQLVSVFDNLPQLPFSHFRLSFRQGQRSPLVTPSTCGTYTTHAELTPWANPSDVLHDAATFQITNGVGGGSCPSGSVPFNPGLIAGAANDSAGAYSPLDIRITRNDGEQEITGFSSLLPPGVTANLSGVPFCSEADIAVARGKSGAQEESEPSCPGASQIGHTLVGVGVGSVLAYTPGKLYMAGPFEGAPFSVVSITSAKVGPFDLGTVIVHLPLNIDPMTAQVSIPAGAADQIPHIVKGIVVHIRDIRVYVDRGDFTKNPTNCNPLTFAAGVIGSGQNFASSADDTAFGVSDRFQAADCANLAFKPDFKVSTNGKTSKANGASLTVKLVYPNAPQGTQSNIHLVKVELPKQLPSRLTTLQKACTAAQFKTNPAGCPAASVVGHARAFTPILPVPLEGPAYFVSNGGEAFPNLIMVLQGYGITIDLVGSTFISKAGITSSTFKTVPDQPVTSFELTLPQGPYSALAANGNLCASKLSMPTEMIGQNGALLTQSTRVSVTGCSRAKGLTRAQKLARALKACHKKHKHAKRKACERTARKKYGPAVKKAKKK